MNFYRPLVITLTAIIALVYLVNVCNAGDSGINKFDSLILSLPSEKWALEVRSPGFKVEDSGIRMNSEGVYFLARNTESMLTISIYIEKAEAPGDSDVCRDTYMKKLKASPFQRKDVKFSKYGSMSVVQYSLGSPFGDYKHLNAYMVKDGFWIDVHLSSGDVKFKDASKFLSILDSMQVIDKYPRLDSMADSRPPEKGSFEDNFVKLATVIEKRNKRGGTSFSAPGMNHALSVNMDNFKMLDERLDPRWNHKLVYARDVTNKINMTIDLIEPLSKGGSTAYRDLHMKQMERDRYKRSEIKKYETNGNAILEFMINENEGKEVFLKNFIEYLSCEDMWAIVHVSTMPYKEDSDAKLKKVLESVRIIDRFGQDAYSYWTMGNDHYNIKKDYDKAIEAYERAREVDSKKSQLDRYAWIIMMDNLGMAYGMTGKLDKAIEIFNTGIGRYPEHPFFYYCLACAYAEKKDIETALIHLEDAYKRRGHTFLGEKPANPMTDDSFKPFWDNEKLKAGVLLQGQN